MHVRKPDPGGVGGTLPGLASHGTIWMKITGVKRCLLWGSGRLCPVIRLLVRIQIESMLRLIDNQTTLCVL